MKQNPQTLWHNLPPEQLLSQFDVQLGAGLSGQAAESRLADTGPNRLTPPRGKGPLRLLLAQFHQPLIYILLFSAATTAFLEEWADSSVIFGVVLVNAIIGFVQEANALKAINALAQTLNLSANVLRDGQRRTIAAADLVPGDLVYLQSGDKVPADLRLLQTRELKIDEAALTGESVPAEKQAQTLAAATLLADRTNMAYSSTLVSYGSALAVVVGTGDNTEIGRINRLIAAAEPLETPLTRKMSQFSQLLLWVIVACAALTFAVGVWRGESALDMFMASVALAVGAIPEACRPR
ncbi:HAD-IC family P-type ATPase [Methylomonas koyamae]|uniref:HAD-IC family P-type ATPase n=1 Tax=Methylomonas koyamae TaxID=702114 RepID=UPI000AFD56AF|nr:HAD-IC family P-type ATPase [Methylomonas koyamae]